MKTEHPATGKIQVCIVSLFTFKVNWCGKNQINWLSKLSPSPLLRSACTDEHSKLEDTKDLTNETLVFVYLYIVCSFIILLSVSTFNIPFQNNKIRTLSLFVKSADMHNFFRNRLSRASWCWSIIFLQSTKFTKLAHKLIILSQYRSSIKHGPILNSKLLNTVILVWWLCSKVTMDTSRTSTILCTYWICKSMYCNWMYST